MKQVISLVQTANQSFSCVLEGDTSFVLEMNLRTMPSGFLIADISIDGEQKVLSAICNNLMPLLPQTQGNLYFEDLYGNESPVYSGFNDRYRLVWDSEYFING